MRLMNRDASTMLVLGLLLFPGFAATQEQPTLNTASYQGWQHAGSIYILTTPDGANLPDSATVVVFRCSCA